MKKLVFFVLVGCATINKAQPYGEWFPHEHDLHLTSASYNLNTPGHLMAGHYIQNLKLGKFKLLKVDQSVSSIFDEDYDVYADAYCQTSPGFAIVDGVCAIETSSSTEPYAVSGSVDGGCFFATFDALGVPQAISYFTFPNSITVPRPGQTTLIEIPSGQGGGFLITGSYMGLINGSAHRVMFIIKLDPVGNLVQSSTYHCVALYACHNVGYELEPSSMIISPYTPNPSGQPEIVVVGEANAIGSTACTSNFVAHSEAFFMRIELATLNWISNDLYRHSTNSFVQERNDFNSITPTSFSGQDFFLLGGNSQSSPSASDHAMMMMVGPTGIIKWSYIYNSSFSDTRACMQVVQRISPTYGPTFYGAAISANAGMLCFKVDVNGTPFASTNAVDNFNEFNYQSGHNGIPYVGYQTNNLSVEPNTGSSEGIHIYGNAESNYGLSDNWYLVKAAFNGASGFISNCNNSTLNNQLTTLTGPYRVPDLGVNQITGPTQCSNISIVNTSHTSIINNACSDMSPPSTTHSNNRPSGIPDNSENFTLSVSPNPAQNEIRIECPSSVISSTLKITDLNGRLVGEIPVYESYSGATSYNLGKLNIPDGIYLIEAQTAKGKMVSKLIKQN